MLSLTNAAMEAAQSLLTNIPECTEFRIVFILNTDGEANDGKIAAQEFINKFEKLKQSFPSMQEARTFVLGIGGDHDQKVLGGMSVGESTYYNYPDATLEDMVTDTINNILPALQGNSRNIELQLNTGKTITARWMNNETIHFNEIQVTPEDTYLILPDGSILPFMVEIVDSSTLRYFHFRLNGVKRDILSLARDIKQYTSNNSTGDMNKLIDYSNKSKNLRATLIQLEYNPLLDINLVVNNASSSSVVSDTHMDSTNCTDSTSGDDTFIFTNETIRQFKPNKVKTTKNVGANNDGSGIGSHAGSPGAQWKKNLYSFLLNNRHNSNTKPVISIPTTSAPESNSWSDQKTALLSVLDLCDTGIQCIRLGQKLGAELERDYMEVLGSGGYDHWTNKKKSKLLAKALDQINLNAVDEIDAKVNKLVSINKAGNTNSKTGGGIDTADVEGIEKNFTCWFTQCDGKELAQNGDILCIVGYIKPGARNLPLCSVSSAKVLHQAILRKDIYICPEPMSFLTLRELLLRGHEIARGPHGYPINTCFCLVPSPMDELSNDIGKLYSLLCSSQLLTSRWTYTVVSDVYVCTYVV